MRTTPSSSVLKAFRQHFFSDLATVSRAHLREDRCMSMQQSAGRGGSGKKAMDKLETPGDDALLTRRELAIRWKVSIQTLKRRERARMLRPMKLEGRIVRYRISDVLQIEKEGYGN
jgi:hypothetical protein